MKKSIFWKLFFDSYKNCGLFCLGMIFNVIAACFEGLSFGTILLALTVLGGDSTSLWSHPVASFFNLHFLSGLTTQVLFTLFIILAISMQVVRSGMSYLGQVYMLILGARIQSAIQKNIYKHIFSFSFSCISHYKVGDLTEYATTPINVVASVMDALNRFIVSVFMIVALVVAMCTISLNLSLLVIPLFCLLGVLQQTLVKKITHFSKKMSVDVADFSKQIVQNLYGIRAIFTFNRQADMQIKINKTIDAATKNHQAVLLWNASVTPINEILSIALVGACLIVGPYLMEGKDVLPLLLTFITVTYRLATRVQILIVASSAIAAFMGPILRLKEILGIENKVFAPKGGAIFQGLRHSIEFRSVSLQYSMEQRFSLEKLSFEVLKGSTVALVGASGAGKSSVADLLVRLYEPTEGSIVVDGVPLNTYEMGSWRDKLGVVSQDSFIFNESIEDNIRFGTEERIEAIERVARIAGAHEFIQRLPYGYQTIVGERGYRLSGGERQRLALARALLRNPEILILDEATSNLDSHSEYIIQQALEQIRKERTIIIIAHRLSTIVKADRIMVMEKGGLVELGTHAELINSQGPYAGFWKIQSG